MSLLNLHSKNIAFSYFLPRSPDLTPFDLLVKCLQKSILLATNYGLKTYKTIHFIKWCTEKCNINLYFSNDYE